MLVGVEAHEVSSFLGNLNFPLPAYHCGMLRGEASIIIKAVEPTAPMVALWHAGAVHGAAAHRGRYASNLETVQ